MRLGLTNESYRYGSYTRGDFKGDILFGVISYAGIDGFVAFTLAMARDQWAERHRGMLDEKKLAAYQAEIGPCVKAAAAEDAPLENVYDAVIVLRRRIFGPDVDRMFLRDAEMEDGRLEKTDIDQTDLMETLMERGGSVLFLLEDARLARVMGGDIRHAREKGLRLYAAVSKEESGLFPSKDLLQSLYPSENVRAVFCEGPLDTLDGEEALARDVAAGRALILCYGEKGLTDCRNLAVPAFVRCLPEGLLGRAVAGQFIRKGQCCIYVPAGFDIVPKVPVTRRTIAAYRQYACLCRAHDESIYHLPPEKMYRLWPEEFFSIYEEENQAKEGFPQGIVWPDTPMDADWYGDFCARRNAAISRLIGNTPGLRVLGGWFSLEGLTPGPIPWTARGEARGIMAHGVLIERPVEAKVILAEGEALSPRKLTEENGDNRLSLILNYLFFLTPRLAELYNRLRSGRPREQAVLPGSHMDYMRCERDGRRVETFPLYRKSCMALKADGTFSFFHFRLGGGRCAVNGQPIRWEKEDVDPEAPGETAVYTPYCSCPDAGASKFEYTKEVGIGRVNLVLIQDRLICARDGGVLLPGIGVVLSVEREKGLQFLSACGFTEAEDGYYSWNSAPELETDLDAPEGFEPEEWKNVQWAYGGGLTLIENGDNCFADEETAKRHLTREGWMSPLSCQTQESDIGSMVRHPRTAVGLTKDGKLFMLVYSGRSSVSAGADYMEMCRIALQLVPDAWHMMNVDGGGSSVLGVAVGRHFMEYSWPSTSPGSLAGMARPINSIFTVRLS